MSDLIKRHLSTFTDPDTMTSDKYGRFLRGFNASIKVTAKDALARHGVVRLIQDTIETRGSAQSKSIEILTTGSDGRGEKGPSSPIEAIVLISRSVREETIQALENSILGALGTINRPETDEGIETDLRDKLKETGLFNETIEVKDMQRGLLYCYQGDPNKPWPSRIFDAATLTLEGPSLLQLAKYRLILEILEHKIKILKKQKERLREYRRICDRKGNGVFKDRKIKHFDLERGVSTYDPKNGIASFKYGPLRTTQGIIERRLTHLVTTHNAEDSNLILTTLPVSTTDKLHFLHAIGLVRGSTSEIAELCDLYEYFLWQYHRSEFNYRFRNTTRTTIDPQEVRENLRNFMRIQGIIDRF